MRRAIFLLIVLAVFAAMAAAVTLRAIGPFGGEGGAAGGFGGRSTPVAVAEVQVEEFADIVEALGTANANESVTITAKVSDTIARLNFDSGDYVEAGRILVELSDAEEAAGLSEARATLREAQREIDRVRDLTERGVAPRSRLDEALAVVERARARVEAIEARVADRIIRAPFSGVVGLRQVSLGQLVRPGDAIARVDDTSVIKLDFTVPERFLSVIEPGMGVQARTSAFPDRAFEGEIAQIDSRVDPVTRTVMVRALIDNEAGMLRPGQLMTVEVRRDVRERPAVPQSAVTLVRDQAFVYRVADSEGGAVARQTPVVLGMRRDGLVEITDGLSVGDRVVAEGVHRVRDGAPVSVVDGGERRERSQRSGGPASTVSGD
jgi:membrane fusion protein (multidrug efflux system)